MRHSEHMGGSLLLKIMRQKLKPREVFLCYEFLDGTGLFPKHLGFKPQAGSRLLVVILTAWNGYTEVSLLVYPRSWMYFLLGMETPEARVNKHTT